MGNLLGCKLYNNDFTRLMNLPLVLECSVSGKVNGVGEAFTLVSEAIRSFNAILDSNWVVVEDSVSVERPGTGFTLYKFLVACCVGAIGEVRLVTYRGEALNISGALTGDAVKGVADPDAHDVLAGGGAVEWGELLGNVYLRPLSAPGGWPPGQSRARRFVIYAAEGIPRVDPGSWRLKVGGRVAKTLELSYADLRSREEYIGVLDFHCVTGWSVPEVKWSGVPLRELAREAGAQGRWVMAVSAAGYTTVIPWSELDNTIVVTSMNGRPLTIESGFPARLFNPRLYGWKALKWLDSIIFLDDYVDGFWEALAYHERGLVWAEERFKVRNPEVAERGTLI